MTGITAWVPGVPVPQGSHVVRRGRITDQQGERLGEWRDRIGWTMRAARKRAGYPNLLTGPVGLRVWTVLPRPPSYAADEWIAATSQFHGDADKHLRAVFDGLTGSVVVNDSQIIDPRAPKLLDHPSWEHGTGALIYVCPVTLDNVRAEMADLAKLVAAAIAANRPVRTVTVTKGRL